MAHVVGTSQPFEGNGYRRLQRIGKPGLQGSDFATLRGTFSCFSLSRYSGRGLG